MALFQYFVIFPSVCIHKPGLRVWGLFVLLFSPRFIFLPFYIADLCRRESQRLRKHLHKDFAEIKFPIGSRFPWSLIIALSSHQPRGLQSPDLNSVLQTKQPTDRGNLSFPWCCRQRRNLIKRWLFVISFSSDRPTFLRQGKRLGL